MKRKWLIAIGGALVVLLLVRLLVLDIIWIPNDSQCPRKGRVGLINRWSYGYRLPWNSTKRMGYSLGDKSDWVAYNEPTTKRSDQPDTTAVCVGCVVATPGDTLWYDNKTGKIAGRRNAKAGYVHPLIVPVRGRSYSITPDNVRFYAITIMQHEPVKASVLGDSLVVSGKLVKRYTFFNDYYWITDESSNASHDSRSYGFVPQKLLIGKIL